VSLAGGCQPGTAVSLGRNVYPQKHDQEDQDRIRHDPHDVGSQRRLSSTACSLMAGPPWGRNAWVPHSACHRMDGQVLGADLNCSESRYRLAANALATGRPEASISDSSSSAPGHRHLRTRHRWPRPVARPPQARS
jgi:hypothetical protein